MICMIEASNSEVHECGRACDCINGAGPNTDVAELMIVELAQGVTYGVERPDVLPGILDRRQEPPRR